MAGDTDPRDYVPAELQVPTDVDGSVDASTWESLGNLFSEMLENAAEDDGSELFALAQRMDGQALSLSVTRSLPSIADTLHRGAEAIRSLNKQLEAAEEEIAELRESMDAAAEDLRDDPGA